MGYEIQGRVSPPIEIALLEEALKEKFVSCGWKIVRGEKDIFSGAFAVRESTAWDEDFVVGLGYTDYLLKNTSHHGNAVEADAFRVNNQIIVYLLSYVGLRPMWDALVPAVDAVVMRLGSKAIWEEI